MVTDVLDTSIMVPAEFAVLEPRVAWAVLVGLFSLSVAGLVMCASRIKGAAERPGTPSPTRPRRRTPHAGAVGLRAQA